MSETPALAVSGVSSGYGAALIVRNASLEIAPGEILALLGKNGMGKSTLLKTIMGFLPVHGGGSVRVFGDVVSGLPPYRVARRAIAKSCTLFSPPSTRPCAWRGGSLPRT